MEREDPACLDAGPANTEAIAQLLIGLRRLTIGDVANATKDAGLPTFGRGLLPQIIHEYCLDDDSRVCELWHKDLIN